MLLQKLCYSKKYKLCTSQLTYEIIGPLVDANPAYKSSIFCLFKDTLLVAEMVSGSGSKGNQLKFKERRVFLFEQIILLSEMTEKKRGNVVSTYYLFKHSLKVRCQKCMIIFEVTWFKYFWLKMYYRSAENLSSGSMACTASLFSDNQMYNASYKEGKKTKFQYFVK